MLPNDYFLWLGDERSHPNSINSSVVNGGGGCRGGRKDFHTASEEKLHTRTHWSHPLQKLHGSNSGAGISRAWKGMMSGTQESRHSAKGGDRK